MTRIQGRVAYARLPVTVPKIVVPRVRACVHACVRVYVTLRRPGGRGGGGGGGCMRAHSHAVTGFRFLHHSDDAPHG